MPPHGPSTTPPGAAAAGLGSKIQAFVIGSANMISTLGVPRAIGIVIMGVFVASFAGDHPGHSHEAPALCHSGTWFRHQSQTSSEQMGRHRPGGYHRPDPGLCQRSRRKRRPDPLAPLRSSQPDPGSPGPDYRFGLSEKTGRHQMAYSRPSRRLHEYNDPLGPLSQRRELRRRGQRPAVHRQRPGYHPGPLDSDRRFLQHLHIQSGTEKGRRITLFFGGADLQLPRL